MAMHKETAISAVSSARRVNLCSTIVIIPATMITPPRTNPTWRHPAVTRSRRYSIGSGRNRLTSSASAGPVQRITRMPKTITPTIRAMKPAADLLEQPGLAVHRDPDKDTQHREKQHKHTNHCACERLLFHCSLRTPTGAGQIPRPVKASLLRYSLKQLFRFIKSLSHDRSKVITLNRQRTPKGPLDQRTRLALRIRHDLRDG